MSTRIRRFFIFIGAAFVLTPIAFLVLFGPPEYTYRQIPQSEVTFINSTHYKSPIPPLIHQVFFFPDGTKNNRHKTTKYQLSWQSSQFAYTFYSDTAAL